MPALVQGHRIGGRLAPENSMQAVAVASKLGIHSVEFDVRKTSDGVLVVSHGPEFPGVRSLTVEETTFDELQHHPLPGSTDQFTPRLDSVVKGCVEGGLFMNVEIKHGHADSVPEVLQLLRDLGAAGRFCISSFDREALRRVFQADPSVAVGSLYNGALSREKRAPTPADFATWWDDLRPANSNDSVNLCQETITEEEVRAARAAGKKVMIWFPGQARHPEWDDSDERLRHLLSFGPDVICTNRPDILKKLTSSSL
eukprot:Hpha_TRINITY_DN9590_c0_g1::TRINITY_DN9590_c0_g1_i1::g.114804::m.114804/K01126/E3.1.4.46, glpQ, ugpQ; glycerophosphoryl diester phosphodiesterase